MVAPMRRRPPGRPDPAAERVSPALTTLANPWSSASVPNLQLMFAPHLHGWACVIDQDTVPGTTIAYLSLELSSADRAEALAMALDRLPARPRRAHLALIPAPRDGHTDDLDIEETVTA